MINSNMTPFQQRLAGVEPLLLLFLFFILLLFGAWLSYKRIRKYRKKYGEDRLFYRSGDLLIIDKLKSEIFFEVFVPLHHLIYGAILMKFLANTQSSSSKSQRI